MKRRQRTDAAAVLASLLAVSLGSTGLVAAPPAEPSRPVNRFTINDNSVTQTSARSTVETGAMPYDAPPSHCDACAPCDVCQDPGVWFSEFEALLWWRKSRPLPPLVSTSLPGTDQADAGVLDFPGTRILFGGENLRSDLELGGRVTFGRWLTPERQFGVAASYWALGQDDIRFNRTAADINEILAIPFFNEQLGEEDALLVNFPGLTTGGQVSVAAQNDVQGVDLYARYLVYAEEGLDVEAIGGYQFTRLDDSLRLNATYEDIANLPNQFFDVTDVFNARNEFHGGSVGFLATAYRGRWTVKALGKVGLGNMHQVVTINGQTITTPSAGGASTTATGGLLALPTNIGTYTNDEFGIVPEGRLNVGYQLTPNWTVGVGYSFLYWNDIVTAGSTVDRVVNPTQIPGPLVGDARPAFAFGERSDYWVQGLNFTAEFVY